MNPTQDNRRGPAALPDEDDPRVPAALKEYQAALESGSRPDRTDFLRRHSEIAAELAEALDALDFVSSAMSRLQPPAPRSAQHVPPVAPGATLGDYRIVREIGRGGMGIVYEAVQQPLGRRVALKILPLQVAASARHLERFQREAQAAARLHHTNIVPVFGVGQHDGVPYYAMQFIAGRPLDVIVDRLRGQPSPDPHQSSTTVNAAAKTPAGSGRGDIPVDRPTPDPTNALPLPETALELAHGHAREYFRAAARAGLQIAEALQHAHEHVVLHRDIKPSNLLMDREGTVWVTDFGLAKFEGPEALTRSGDVIGTLRYLAPERLKGEADARSDVYALGLTLYELLALRPAFNEDDPTLLMQMIGRDEPAPPRRFVPGIPRDLETVVLKAIAKEPSARYASAEDVAEDLRRFLADRPVQARRQGWFERLLRWCRRNPALALFVGLFAVALASVAGVSAAFAVNKDHDARELERAGNDLRRHAGQLEQKNHEWRDLVEKLKREEERKRAALVMAAHLTQDRGRVLCEQGDVAEGLLWLASSLTVAPEDAVELQRFGRANLAAWNAHLSPLRMRLRHTKPILSLAVSKDGKRLLAGSVDGEALLFDTVTGEPVGETLRHKFNVGNSSFSPDGRLALTSGGDGQAFLWDASTGKAVGKPFKHGEQHGRAVFMADGKRIATSGGGKVRFWTLEGEPLGKEITYSGEAMSIVLAPDGKTAVVGSSDRTARIWDLETGKTVGQPMPHNNWVTGLVYDGKVLASISADQQVRLWNPTDGKLLKRPGMHSGRINGLALSPDSKVLATASEDKTVRLWSVETGQPLGKPLAHRAGVRTLAFSPDGKLLASAGGDTLDERGEARLWSVAAAAPFGMPLPSVGPVNAVRFSADGKALYVAGGRMLPSSGEVRVWDVPAGAGESPLPVLRHDKQILVILFSPDGKTVLTGSYDGTARLWDAATGHAITDPIQHGEPVTVGRFSADGKSFVAGGGKAGVRVHDARTGKPRGAALAASEDNVTLAQFSPDGRLLATGTATGEFRVWESDTGKAVGPGVRQDGGAVAAAFNASGKLLLTAGRSSAQVSEVSTGKAVGPAAYPGAALHTASLAADGRHATLVLNRGKVVRYDVAEGLPGKDAVGEGTNTCAAVSLDGRTILAAGPLKEARLLDGETGKPLGPELRPSVLHVHFVALANDGRTAATAGGLVVQLWDAVAGRQIGPPLLQPRRATFLALSPDGRRLAATSEDGTARLYVLPDLSGDAERLMMWVQVRTGMELDGRGEVRSLTGEELAGRRARLGRLPGPALP